MTDQRLIRELTTIEKQLGVHQAWMADLTLKHNRLAEKLDDAYSQLMGMKAEPPWQPPATFWGRLRWLLLG